MPRRAANAAPPAHSATTRAFVQWIRSAAPYIHAFRGKTFVIAFGGEVVADDTFLGIIHDLNLLHSLGIQLVVVHGSRPQIEAILAQQDIESRYASGLRITDTRGSKPCFFHAATARSSRTTTASSSVEIRCRRACSDACSISRLLRPCLR